MWALGTRLENCASRPVDRTRFLESPAWLEGFAAIPFLDECVAMGTVGSDTLVFQ